VELYEHFLNNRSAPIHKSLHYFPIYERHFRRYVGLPITVIEIGGGGGGSSQMWRRYFGPLARIIVLDIRPECQAFEDQQVSVRIGDQSDETFLQSIINEFGQPDIVIDDGSHIMSHVTTTFSYLYPKMSSSGVYLVEDLHTAYWEEYGGGMGRPGTFVELCKGMIDELHADYSRGAIPQTPFSKQTLSMHVYDSIIAFERGVTPSKASVVTGDPNLTFG
jgi:hypothetical protein